MSPVIPKSEYPTIVALYRNGASGAAVARNYGVSRERIRQIVSHSDPNALFERKKRREEIHKRRRTCSCGGEKHYESSVCRKCANKAAKKWTKELIIERIQEFEKETGNPPSAADFSPALARSRNSEHRAKRWEDSGRYPSTGTVVNTFGSWAGAIRAAGMTPNRGGRPAKGGKAAGVVE